MLKQIKENQKRRKWINSLPKIGRKVTRKLFTKYQNITESQIKIEVKNLFNLISNNIKLEESVFANIVKSRYGGSDVFVGHFVKENDLYGIAYKTINIDDFTRAKTIVLIDDIISSGDSAIRSLNKLIKNPKLRTKKIIVISLFSTINAKEKLSNYKKTESIDLEVYSKHDTRNAFERRYLFNDSTALVTYSEMCDVIGIKDYRLGYNEDAILLSFFYNTPNNTLGLFWSEENGHKPYFKRNKSRRPSISSMKESSSTRKSQPHKFPTEDPDSYKKILFAVYVCEKGMDNMNEIKRKFGVNDSQIINMMNELLTNNMIKKKRKKFELTEVGNNYIEKETYNYVRRFY